MESKKKTPKRIIFDVSEYEHNLIKKKALNCGMSIKRYIMRVVMLEVTRAYKQ